MSSDIFDNTHLADIGAEYEYFIGAYFEIIHKCFVIYQGRLLGKEDSGVDLIAVSRSKTYLVQCKNYRRSVIHENAVNQLGGSARSFSQRFPEARNVSPVIFTTTDFDAQAQFAGEANNVQLRVMPYEKKTVDSRLVFFNNILSTEFHHSPTYDLPLPEDYDLFVRKALSRCNPASEGRHAAPDAEQTAQKTKQIVQKPKKESVSPVPYMRSFRTLWIIFYIAVSTICVFALLVTSRTTNVYLHAVLNSVYHSGFSAQSKYRRRRLWLYKASRPVFTGLCISLILIIAVTWFSSVGNTNDHFSGSSVNQTETVVSTTMPSNTPSSIAPEVAKPITLSTTAPIINNDPAVVLPAAFIPILTKTIRITAFITTLNHVIS